METNFKLLQCPFCGKMESVQVRSMSQMIGDEFDDGLYESYAVVCNANESAGFVGCGAKGGYADSKLEAISKWNMRKEL